MECQGLHMSFLSPHHSPTSNPTRPDVFDYALKHSHKPTNDNPTPSKAMDEAFNQMQSGWKASKKLILNHNLAIQLFIIV